MKDYWRPAQETDPEDDEENAYFALMLTEDGDNSFSVLRDVFEKSSFGVEMEGGEIQNYTYTQVLKFLSDFVTQTIDEQQDEEDEPLKLGKMTYLKKLRPNDEHPYVVVSFEVPRYIPEDSDDFFNKVRLTVYMEGDAKVELFFQFMPFYSVYESAIGTQPYEFENGVGPFFGIVEEPEESEEDQ